MKELLVVKANMDWILEGNQHERKSAQMHER